MRKILRWLASLRNPTICPTCERNDRVSWRDGLWACWSCDLK